jgi:thiol-disulfide isomerase/thioredoxin
MKTTFTIGLMLFSFVLTYGQNEQSPLVEKEISYKNWELKGVKTGDEVELRNLAKGKKLVMVVYFAPWCPNWKHDAPLVQRLYDKYKANGLEVVGIGEYDPVDAMKTNLENLKVTFPVVYESESRADKQKTPHYEYRKSTGDTRNWGSPWYIFLEPAKIEKIGDVLARKANVVNGEIVETEVEKMIREKLGLPATTTATLSKGGEIEPCPDDNKKTSPMKP